MTTPATPNFATMNTFDDPYKHADPFANGLRHIYSAKQFLDHTVLNSILDRADVMKKQVEAGLEVDTPIRSQSSQRKKHMYILFVDSASTRTIRSTERAASLVGMTTVVDQSLSVSSMGKGESWEHTIAALSAMLPDAFAIRSNDPELVMRAMKVASVPVINCGNGNTGEHPTQMLGDQYTIRNRLKRLNNLKIVVIGDVRNARVLRSNLTMWSSYTDNSFEFFSPKDLTLAPDIRATLDAQGSQYAEHYDRKDLRRALKAADVVYAMADVRHALATGAQKYLSSADIDDFVIDWDDAEVMQSHALLMHPLPSCGEIRPRLDYHPRSIYAPHPGKRDIDNEMTSGLIARMAALEWVFGYTG